MENLKKKKSLVDMEFTTFKIPPSGDILVLGKRCAIGPRAGKRMLDTVAPDQFELVQLEDDLIDGILVKKQLFSMVDKDSLINALIEELKPIMSDQSMLTIKCDITVTIRREI